MFSPKFFVAAIAVLTAFTLGYVLKGHESRGPSETGDRHQGHLADKRDEVIRDLEKHLDESRKAHASSQAELDHVRSGHESRLAEAQQQIQKLQKELEDAKALAARGGGSSEKAKPGKKFDMGRMVKMGLEMQHKQRLRKLKNKVAISPYQEEAINKLLDEYVDAMARQAEELFSDAESMEDRHKKSSEFQELFSDDKLIEKLRGVMDYQQIQAYQEIIEDERRQQVRAAATMYVDGNFGFTGMADSVGLSPEQKKTVQSLFEEKFGAMMGPKGGTDRAARGMPFDDPEFVNRLRATLTPDQYPKLDAYLKEQKEFMEGIGGGFMMHVGGQAEEKK